MAVTYKPDVTFTWTAGEHTSAAVAQPGRHALIAVQSPSNFRGLGTSPGATIFVQFLGSFTLAGAYSPIKNSTGIVSVQVKVGLGYAHPLDPADFAGFPFVKAQVVGALGGTGIAQLAAKTMPGKLYEV